MNFHDFLEQEGLKLVKPPEGDGSFEVDGQDCSWSIVGKDHQELRTLPYERVWTVMDGEDDLFIGQGFHHVNRMYYLVTDKPYTGPFKDEEFTF